MKIAICDDEQIYIDAIKSRVCPIMEKEGKDKLRQRWETSVFNRKNW